MPRRDASGNVGYTIVVAILLVASLVMLYFSNNTPDKVQPEGLSAVIETAPRGVARPERERLLTVVSRSNDREEEPKQKPKPVSEPVETPAPQPVTKEKTTSGTVPALLQIIIDHESGGNYRAYNPTGCSDENGTWSCGGKYQLSSQFAAGWAANNGYPGQSSNAAEWAPEVQDAVALALFNKTNGGLWCNYTSYC